MNVKELGEHLYLDSGTLTPVLKKLEQKGWVERARDRMDERVLIVTLTPQGRKLQEQAAEVPAQIGACIRIEEKEAIQLYHTLYRILEGITGE